jgi:hypothetical protein
MRLEGREINLDYAVIIFFGIGFGLAVRIQETLISLDQRHQLSAPRRAQI